MNGLSEIYRSCFEKKKNTKPNKKPAQSLFSLWSPSMLMNNKQGDLTSCSCWRLQFGASFINLLHAASHTEVVVYKNKVDRNMCTPVTKLTRVKIFNWNQVVKMKCERHYSTHNNAAHIWFHTCSTGSFLRINIQVVLCADSLCLNVGVERVGWGWSMCVHFEVNLGFLKGNWPYARFFKSEYFFLADNYFLFYIYRNIKCGLFTEFYKWDPRYIVQLGFYFFHTSGTLFSPKQVSLTKKTGDISAKRFNQPVAVFIAVFTF